TLNTKALRALGLFEKIPETIREGVDRDEKGMPSGVMRGPAETYVYKNMPPQGEAEVLQALEEAMKLYASSGITSVQSCDFGTFRVPFRTTLKAYKKLDRGKKLPLRVNLMAHLDTRESLEDFLSLSIRTGQGSDYCRMGPYKLQPDGSLGTWSARLRSPYQDKPESRGIWNHSEEEFFSLMYQAHHAGMQLVADAIGDACIDMVLNTYEKILGPQGGLQHRPGIDHCQITAPQQIERFRNLSIIAGLEFTFLPSDMPIIIRRIGEKRSKNSYNWKEFFLQNVPVAPGSDSPVEFWAPLWGIQAAVTRKKEGKTFLPEQRLSIEQALRSYTLGSAFASFEEHCKGSLRRGSFADLVLLREDPHRVSPEEIKDIPIGATITGGRVVYRNDSITPPELDLLRHP
ncbi:MAG TPA: amidohydrolase, partial [Synergistaceae bacterium]|nr:amidohydrolase [Synergistaceae bacterium]